MAVEVPPASKGSAPDTRDETYWRTRSRELRDRVARYREDLAALETRLREISRSGEGAAADERERALTSARVTDVKTALSSAGAELLQFETAAREANVPAAWLR
jgi:hypothetical protein